MNTPQSQPCSPRIEAAAREYCRLCGQDPDREVAGSPESDGYGITCDVLVYRPLWEAAARDILDHERIARALAATAEDA